MSAIDALRHRLAANRRERAVTTIRVFTYRRL